MSNSEFIIPSFEVQNDASLVANELPMDDTVERHPDSYIKCVQIERSISEMRSVAINTITSKSRHRQAAYYLSTGIRPDEKSFVDRESLIGGKLFEKQPNTINQRFWSHYGDWFYANTERTAAGQRTIAVHYQPDGSTMRKFINGKEYPVLGDELDRLSAAAENHYNELKQLYVNEKLI